MIKEAIEKLVSLAAPTLTTVHGLPYSDTSLHLLMKPGLATVSLKTLTGLVDVIRAKADELDPANWLIQVCSHADVRLVSRNTDEFGRRSELARAELHDGKPFPFGLFVGREEFVIGLQSRFVQDGDLLNVLRLASNLEAGTVAQAEDDGISQRTTVRQGITLKESVIVKGRVVLRPYRTFREVVQPASEFVFRLRSPAGDVPECALFEADGGKWMLDAVLTIKQWLDAQALDIPVIA